MVLSVIMPVFNEASTLTEIVEKVLNLDIDLELIIVDDGSTDGSSEILKQLSNKYKQIILLTSNSNQGKGAAIRKAIPICKGEIITTQDADLETNPEDLYHLIDPIIKGESMVVYGSRILGNNGKHFTKYYYGAQFITGLTNLLYGIKITDEPCCYKVIKADILKSIPLKCKGFEYCPEITAKLSKKGISILEKPVDYFPRSKAEGKKLKIKDGFIACWTLLKYRFVN